MKTALPGKITSCSLMLKWQKGLKLEMETSVVFTLMRLMNWLSSIQSCVSHLSMDWSLQLLLGADLLPGLVSPMT